MKSAVLWLLLLLPLVGALCPKGCECADSARSVRCDGAGLRSVPILLNPQLRSLSLAANQLARLDADALRLYSELEFLDLSGNAISAIPPHVFAALQKLKVLRLAGNNVSALERDSFVGLYQLQALDLSNNRIDSVAQNTFADLSALLQLNLAGNSLHLVTPNVFSGLGILSELDLSANKLDVFPRALFAPLSALRQLDLSSNLIVQLNNAAFAGLQQLVRLDLGRNVLGALDDGAFSGLNALKALNLSSNMLRRVPSRALTSLTELEVLDLSANLFPELPTSAFDGLSALKRLSLSHLQSLRAVHMNAFSGLLKLLELDLSRCPLLEALDEHAFERPNLLRALDLSHGRLQRLSARLLDWEQLESLRLHGNPWNCDCELLRFLPATVRRLAVPHAVCARPDAMAGQPVGKLSATFCTDFSDTAMSAVVVGSLLTVLSMLLCILFCLRARLGRRRSEKEDADASRAPLYTRQTLLDSLTYDKTDLLLSNRCFLSSNPSPVGSQHENDDDYYASVRAPTVYDSKYAFYRHMQPTHVAPPMMPPTLPPLYPPATTHVDGDVENQYRIVAQYPVPITEL